MDIDVAALPLGWLYLLLAVTGWPLPMPEDLVIMGAGWNAAQTGEPVQTLAVCYAGVLTRDASIYVCARVFGRRLLKLPLLGRLVAGERSDKLETWIKKDGRKTVFLARFLPAVRVPTFFTCSLIGLPAAEFFLIDAAAACFTVPIDFALGYFLGPTVIQLVYEEPLAKVVLIGLAIVFVGIVIRRARRSLQSPQAS